MKVTILLLFKVEVLCVDEFHICIETNADIISILNIDMCLMNFFGSEFCGLL